MVHFLTVDKIFAGLGWTSAPFPSRLCSCRSCTMERFLVSKCYFPLRYKIGRAQHEKWRCSSSSIPLAHHVAGSGRDALTSLLAAWLPEHTKFLNPSTKWQWCNHDSTTECDFSSPTIPQNGRGDIHYPEMRLIQKDNNLILFINPSLRTYSKACSANRNRISHVYHGQSQYWWFSNSLLILCHTGSTSCNRFGDNI